MISPHGNATISAKTLLLHATINAHITQSILLAMVNVNHKMRLHLIHVMENVWIPIYHAKEFAQFNVMTVIKRNMTAMEFVKMFFYLVKVTVQTRGT